MKLNTCHCLAFVLGFCSVAWPAQSTDVSTMPNASVTAEGLAKGLVLHLTFDRDETGDNKVTDTSGQGNHGKASGLPKGVVHLSDDDVRFRTAGGVNVFVDPVSWPTDELVVKSGMVKPDLILITHSHGDHFQPTILQEYVSLNSNVILAGPPDVARLAREKGMKATEVKPGQSYTMAGVKFSAVPACFLEGDSHPKANQWVGYVLQLDGGSYYVTGDTQPLPEMAELKVDVLFPLLYGCGGNLEQALKMAELTKARLVVPVHTGGQEEVIKKYLAQLPKGVQGAYYRNGKLIVGP